MSNQAKAVIIFVLIVFITSFGCVMFYHHTYSKPVDESILKLADESFYMGLQNTIQLKGTKDILKKQSIINFGFYVMDKRQNADLDVLWLKKEILEKQVMALQEKVETLERRHLEVIRALAILQKRDWPTEKKFESSGIPYDKLESKEWKLPSAEEAPQAILESIEKELKEWEK